MFRQKRDRVRAYRKASARPGSRPQDKKRKSADEPRFFSESPTIYIE
jgi:hypothetical protein